MSAAAAGVQQLDLQLLEEIKSILRRDLKLGADARIADDMPLIGGEMDLDSLDILLVVSSIEKHFKIKIPNEVVGRWVFQDVSTLTKFVQENRNASGGSAKPQASASQVNWLDRLPHGPEFRFLSQVHAADPGKSAVGMWKVDGSEAFLKAHFPGRPIVPGVLVTEGLAQLAGIAASSASDKQGGMLAHVDVRFESPIVPPAAIEMSATVAREVGALRQCEVIASVAGRPVARGTVAIKFD
jgi:3-hydroxyacyl-[acyl-carrier-protein] dehydratase